MRLDCTIGVDLGGTKVTAGLVSAGEVLARERRLLPVGAEDPPILAQIESCIAVIVTAAAGFRMEVGAIGVGIPAVADGAPGQASTRDCPTLPLLERCDLARAIERRFSRSVAVGNDANCFALGEALAGAGRGHRDLVGLTLGTGIGCGLVLDGKIHAGSRASAGEIWNLPMPGGGILEDTLSGAGVARQAGAASALKAAEAARGGDARAREAWRQYGWTLALAIGWIERLVDPELFVLGGSIAAAADVFLPGLNEQAPGRPVLISKLGEDAALIGAASLIQV